MNTSVAEREKQMHDAERLLFSGPEKFGLAKGLFFGRFVDDWVMPFPTLHPGEQPGLDEKLKELRSFLDAHLDPRAVDRNAEIPVEVISGLAALGVLGMTAPVDVGGSGLSLMAYCRVMEEIGSRGRVDPAARWLGRIVPPLIRVLYRSWRVRCEGFEAVDAELAAGRRVLLATWHGKLLTVLPHFGPRYSPHVMISQSRDGDRVSAVSARFGVVPVRGSSSRGGARALLQAVRVLEKGHVVGHIVDGPRGPAGDPPSCGPVGGTRSGGSCVGRSSGSPATCAVAASGAVRARPRASNQRQ